VILAPGIKITRVEIQAFKRILAERTDGNLTRGEMVIDLNSEEFSRFRNERFIFIS